MGMANKHKKRKRTMLPLFSLFRWSLFSFFSVHWTIASPDFVGTILVWFDHKFVFSFAKEEKEMDHNRVFPST